MNGAANSDSWRINLQPLSSCHSIHRGKVNSTGPEKWNSSLIKEKMVNGVNLAAHFAPLMAGIKSTLTVQLGVGRIMSGFCDGGSILSRATSFAMHAGQTPCEKSVPTRA